MCERGKKITYIVRIKSYDKMVSGWGFEESVEDLRKLLSLLLNSEMHHFILLQTHAVTNMYQIIYYL